MFACVLFLPLFSEWAFFDRIFTSKNFHIFFVRDLSHDILDEKLFRMWICIRIHVVYECLSSHFTECTFNKTRIKIQFLFTGSFTAIQMNIKIRAKSICCGWRATMTRNAFVKRVFGQYKTFGGETKNRKQNLTKVKEFSKNEKEERKWHKKWSGINFVAYNSIPW